MTLTETNNYYNNNYDKLDYHNNIYAKLDYHSDNHNTSWATITTTIT